MDVGLGELPGAFGEVADPTGVDDDGGRSTAASKGADGGLRWAAGRFQDDALGREGLGPSDELLDAGGRVVEAVFLTPAGRAWASRKSLQTSTPIQTRLPAARDSRIMKEKGRNEDDGVPVRAGECWVGPQ